MPFLSISVRSVCLTEFISSSEMERAILRAELLELEDFGAAIKMKNKRRMNIINKIFIYDALISIILIFFEKSMILR